MIKNIFVNPIQIEYKSFQSKKQKTISYKQLVIDLLLKFSSVAFHVMRQRTDAFKSVREMEHYSALKRIF